MKTLNKPVLILNKNWMPIRVASVKCIMKYLIAKKAQIIDVDDYSLHSWDKWMTRIVNDSTSYISTTQGNVELPEVIVLGTSSKTHVQKVNCTKKNIFRRDGYQCQYTGKKLTRKTANIDHVIPKSRGGKDTWGNLVVCDRNINNRKGNKTPKEMGLKLIRKPGKPRIEDFLFFYNKNIPDSWLKFGIKPRKNI